MNKIEELIQKFCPNGVQKKYLWEVTVWDKKFNGVDRKCQPQIHKYSYLLASEISDLKTEKGDVYLLTTSDKIGWTTEERAGKYLSEGEIVSIPWGGNLNIKYYKGNFVTSDNRIATSIDTSILSNKYLYYWMLSKRNEIQGFYRGAGIKHPNMKEVLFMEICFPPVEVQQEIVRLLDEYTESKVRLLDNLKKEVSLRKKQYEYYLNFLYYESFEKLGSLIKEGTVKGYSLSEVGTFVRGKRFVRNDVVESGCPCIHYGDMYGYYGVKAYKTKTYIKEEKARTLRFAQKGDVVIVGAGENKEDIGVGVAWLGESEPAVHDACYIYKHSEELDSLYISYFLRTQVYHSQIFKHVVEAKICALSSQGIGKAVIPVPSLSKQKRIVSILEQYEEASEKLIEKLNQEIIQVQQQYEYYRDKLLTF